MMHFAKKVYPACSNHLLLLGCLMLGFSLISSKALSDPKLVTHCSNKYVGKLLELALSYSKKQYTPNKINEKLCGTTRELEELAAGSMSVFWTSTSVDMETNYLAVRVPTLRGLLGYRILIIRKGEQKTFDGVRTLEELKKVRFGQGRTWADTQVLQSAGLNVITSNSYTSLFHMLEGNRFDAFPRGISEPWSELAHDFSDLDLEIEKNILIVYPMPAYFFVNKEDKALAKALEKGLKNAIKDGSFDKLFYSDPGVKLALEKGGIESRRRFQINNPVLPSSTPMGNEMYHLKELATQ